MPSNNSKYSQEMREETAKYILENGRSATELTVRALDNAKARSVKQDRIIFHSDRGSQYTSKRYQKTWKIQESDPA